MSSFHGPRLVADGAAPACPDPSRRRTVGLFGGWGLSGAIHLGLIAVLAAAITAPKPPEFERPPLIITALDPVPPTKVPPKVTTPTTIPVPLPTPEVDATASTAADPTPVLPATPVDPSPDQDTQAALPSGDPAITGIIETGSSGLSPNLGAGLGSSGKGGFQRGPEARKRAILRNSGSPVAEDAVNRALRWFKRHQSPDGHWDAVDYYRQCNDGPRCEPGSLGEGGGALDDRDTDVAITGLALLCFLGHGHDHQHPSTFTTNVRRGVAFLLQAQQPGTGLFGHRNYEHAIATMALAEAYGMTGDTALRGPAQRAVDAILARQNPDAGKGGLGWHYTTADGLNDTSVTGWNIMALKSAYISGLSVGRGLTGAKVWLERTWQAANTPRLVQAGVAFREARLMTATDRARFPYLWKTGTDEVAVSGLPGADPVAHTLGMSAKVASPYGGAHSLEGVGLACAAFLGHQAGDPLVESLANTVMAHQMPTRYPCNTYALYYTTMGMFQVGGERWKTWNATVRDVLANSQRRDTGCFDGSWDWAGTGFHGSSVGRTLSTAFCTLSLEVYYRYAQVVRPH